MSKLVRYIFAAGLVFVGTACTMREPRFVVGCTLDECDEARLQLEKRCLVHPERFGYPVNRQDYALLTQQGRFSPTVEDYCKSAARRRLP